MKSIMNRVGMVLVAFAILFSGFTLTTTSAFAECSAQINPETGKWSSGGSDMSLDQARSSHPDCFKDVDELNGKILRFVKILSTLVIVFAVGMVIYGGFKYITSQGDPRQAETAKTQIWYAGVGLFIVLAAFTILQLFMSASGGMQ